MAVIKTLAEILVDMGESKSTSLSTTQTQSSKTTRYPHTIAKMVNGSTYNKSSQNPWQDFRELSPLKLKSTCLPDETDAKYHSIQIQSHNPKKHKSHQENKTASQGNLARILINNTQTILDESTAQTLKHVSIEPIYQNDKAINRLRWLAFYYLSNRELSKKQLHQKLLDKDCDPDMISALLIEFADKGYQSDERCAYMLIREGVRRGRGKKYIKQSLKKAGIDLPYSLDELINQAGIESVGEGTILDDGKTHTDNKLDWLKLAIEVRCKKYGNTVPKDSKEKARQLRFLQYRGFETNVCFDALKYTLNDLSELY